MPTSTLRPLHRESHPPRRCKEDGCSTWLCSFNAEDYCVLHGGWKQEETKDSEARQDFGELLEELMAA